MMYSLKNIVGHTNNNTIVMMYSLKNIAVHTNNNTILNSPMTMRGSIFLYKYFDWKC